MKKSVAIKLIGVMKYRRIISTITLISLLALVITSGGCARGVGVMDMAKKFPNGIDDFVFLDIAVMRGDNNLENVYEDAVDNFDYWLDELGIDFDDVNRVAWGGGSTLLYGNFDLDDVREGLEEKGYDDDEYRNIEIWGSNLEYEWIALMGSYIILGSEERVKDCIEVIEEEEDSMHNDRDFKDVMDMLPSGIAMHYSMYEEYTNLEVSGVSIEKINNDTLKSTAVYKFQDEDAAENAMVNINDDAEDAGLYHVSVSQNNEYIKSTAELDIDDFTL